MSLAERIETEFAPDGLVLDEAGRPTFRLERRIAVGEGFAFWKARVVDEELQAQGAPTQVLIQAVELRPGAAPARLAQALQPLTVDHGSIALCHSVALPKALAGNLPSTPSQPLPPLHSLPLCDQASCLLAVKEATEGIPLAAVLAGNAPRPDFSGAASIAEGIAAALTALHRRGLAHGSISPETVLVVPDRWSTVLLDLGQLRLASPDSTPAAAAAWCGPEAFGISPDPRRTDQFAVAAILYALWTGRSPFTAPPPGTSAGAAAEGRRKEIAAALAPSASAFGALPRGLQSALARALAPVAADRFLTLEAFLAAAQAAAREASSTSSLRGGSFGDVTVKTRAPVFPDEPERAQAAPARAEPEAPTEPPPARPPSGQASVAPAPRPPAERTQIVAAPRYRADEYPDHPDLESKIRKSPGPLDEEDQLAIEAALAHGRWAFNRLAATFLALWLATAAWGLWAGGYFPRLDRAAATASEAGGQPDVAAIEDGP